MGLIKAAGEAIKGEFKDQWKDLISCENMDNNVLMVKKTTETGVISKGSRIMVAPGQVAVIYDSGKVLDATAEPGVYEFNESSSPTFFAGDFGAVFKDMWQRFTYGGNVAKEQAIYFFNTKEIMDNKFGTPNPVTYKDWGHPLRDDSTNMIMPMRVEVKCFGVYTFKITNPALFMGQIAGTGNMYTKEMLTEQMRAEVIGAFSNVMNSLGEDEHKIEVLSLPNKTDEIKEIMDKEVFDRPIRERGVSLISFVIESLTLDDESEQKIDKYELSIDSRQQKGTLTSAYAQAVQDAAKNEGGAMNGFLGVGMMNMGAGGIFGGVNDVFQNNGQNAGAAVTPNDVWVCPKCKIRVSGKFCSECGEKKPESCKCSKCGAGIAEGSKFCPECGEKLV